MKASVRQSMELDKIAVKIRVLADELDGMPTYLMDDASEKLFDILDQLNDETLALNRLSNIIHQQ